MGVRRDALLAIVALAAFSVAARLVDAAVVTPFLLLGGAGTVAFELLAARRAAAIRRVWERPAVQAGSLLAAIGLATVGAAIAPGPVLSAGIGALATYLLVLGGVVARRSFRTVRDRFRR